MIKKIVLSEILKRFLLLHFYPKRESNFWILLENDKAYWKYYNKALFQCSFFGGFSLSKKYQFYAKLIFFFCAFGLIEEQAQS